MRTLLALLLALTLAGCGKAPVEADRLPDVSLPSLAGSEQVSLGDLRGPLVVNVWASWCPPCKRELPHYAAFAEKYDGRVDVLGVDWRDVQPDKARAMLQEAGATYPNVVDLDGVVPARAAPALILVDEHGVEVHREYREIKSVAELEDLVASHLGVTA